MTNDQQWLVVLGACIGINLFAIVRWVLFPKHRTSVDTALIILQALVIALAFIARYGLPW